MKYYEIKSLKTLWNLQMVQDTAARLLLWMPQSAQGASRNWASVKHFPTLNFQPCREGNIKSAFKLKNVLSEVTTWTTGWEVQ